MDFLDIFVFLPLGALMLMSFCFLIADIARGVWWFFCGPVAAPVYPESAPRTVEAFCHGCGAPLDWHQHECPYCRRAKA